MQNLHSPCMLLLTTPGLVLRFGLLGVSGSARFLAALYVLFLASIFLRCVGVGADEACDFLGVAEGELAGAREAKATVLAATVFLLSVCSSAQRCPVSTTWPSTQHAPSFVPHNSLRSCPTSGLFA